MKASTSNIISIDKKVVDEAKFLVDRLNKLSSQSILKTFKSDSVVSLKRKIHFTRQTLSTVSNKLKSTMEKLDHTTTEGNEWIGSRIFRNAPRCQLNLDDAVSVLRNLSFTPAKEKDISKSIESIVGQHVQSALLSMTANGSAGVLARLGDNPNSPRRTDKKRKRNDDHSIPQNQKEIRCYDCGEPGHKRGSSECKRPSFFTSELKKRKNNQGSSSGVAIQGNEKDGSKSGGPFRNGSSAMKRSHV